MSARVIGAPWRGNPGQDAQQARESGVATYLAGRSALDKSRRKLCSGRHATGIGTGECRVDKVVEGRARAENDPHVVAPLISAATTKCRLQRYPKSLPINGNGEMIFGILLRKKKRMQRDPQRHASTQAVHVKIQQRPDNNSQPEKSLFHHSMHMFINPSLASVIPCKPTRLAGFV